ncbi:MAG: hypothetical protein U5L96_07130 [Owenweeksia sp.]|nr:hypothetical protein [Owenweeksia sp.]
MPTYEDTIVVATCPGDSVFAGGAWQNMAGIYTDMYTNTAGCDSILHTQVVLDSSGCTYDC